MTEPVERRDGTADRRVTRWTQPQAQTIRRLQVANLVVGIIAIGALVLALAQMTGRFSSLQTSREKATTDICRVIVTVIHDAYQGDAQRGELVIRRAGLADCTAFAHRLTRTR